MINTSTSFCLKWWKNLDSYFHPFWSRFFDKTCKSQMFDSYLICCWTIYKWMSPVFVSWWVTYSAFQFQNNYAKLKNMLISGIKMGFRKPYGCRCLVEKLEVLDIYVCETNAEKARELLLIFIHSEAQCAHSISIAYTAWAHCSAMSELVGV